MTKGFGTVKRMLSLEPDKLCLNFFFTHTCAMLLSASYLISMSLSFLIVNL